MKYIQRVRLHGAAFLELLKMKPLRKTTQVAHFHPNVQIRVGTRRLHYVERGPFSAVWGTWAKSPAV